MKYQVILYETKLKMIVQDRQYFNSKDDICKFLDINRNKLENFLHKKLKNRKRNNILNRIDIIRKYSYNNKSIERDLKIGIKDLEEILKFIKKNLKHFHKNN
jgi:hypothetical protein